MFTELNVEMARAGMTAKDLSAKTGIKYDTLLNKLRGDTDFNRAEMFKIKNTCFPTRQIDELFATKGGAS